MQSFWEINSDRDLGNNNTHLTLKVHKVFTKAAGLTALETDVLHPQHRCGIQSGSASLLHASILIPLGGPRVIPSPTLFRA